VQAERSAAWAEVARRLAHEIKNPLTPIQLAAERIRHKYLKHMFDEEQGKVWIVAPTPSSSRCRR
jgi:nitrogen fixation/metabolism regulation signal transduction histidine kinase